MVELIGTENQVKWANDIKNDNIRVIERELEAIADRSSRDEWYANDEKVKTYTARVSKALDEIKNDTTHIYASWWIEHKGIANAYIQKIKKAVFNG
ncbi:hypothetical protein OXPF_39140 [Oxobacter pfennigii]|uniref:Uncharacterized protein n=1 Tax=Oxobacter pfennigii TaxID=36849 RepID=A0A0P9AAU1_9CLOT|nr:hypothetical protein [Oxobacter pfennigii]KPU42135.1 hypothetical protein OXPF_39140 [Oxobacter pfennigii]